MKTLAEYIDTHGSMILGTFFLLGMIAVFWIFLSDFGLGESGYNFLGKTKNISLSTTPVTQTFTAREDNLYQIRIVLGNADIRRGESIEFRLMDETCQKVIATKKFTTEPTEQGTYTVFPFSPLAHSKNTPYCFAATYSSDENRKNTPYLSAMDVPDSNFSDRTLTDQRKNKVYQGQTLFLRPAYTTGSLSGDLWNLVGRLSQYKPAFLKGWSIVILFGVFLAGSITLAVSLVFTRKDTSE